MLVNVLAILIWPLLIIHRILFPANARRFLLKGLHEEIARVDSEISDLQVKARSGLLDMTTVNAEMLELTSLRSRYTRTLNRINKEHPNG